MAIIWLCSLSPSSYAAAGKSIVVPALRCPSCVAWLMRWGGYWRWLRAPLLIERVWIRRGRCGVCRRTHALLPDLVLGRRLDDVAVIGRGIALKVIANLGLRSIAEHLDVPHTTVRSWWRRFQAREQVTLGVDTHAELHVAAAFDERGRLLGVCTIPTTTTGYVGLVRWTAQYGELSRVGIEGTGSYGAGLTRWLRARSVTVVDVERPDRRTRRRRGKSDSVDAEAAARSVLGDRT